MSYIVRIQYEKENIVLSKKDIGSKSKYERQYVFEKHVGSKSKYGSKEHSVFPTDED